MRTLYLKRCVRNKYVIPAALKVYHKSLANVDFLHGSAESMLTITNLLIGEVMSCYV